MRGIEHHDLEREKVLKNHNSFLEEIVSNSSQNDISQEKKFETFVQIHTECICGEKTTRNSDDVTVQLLQAVMTKVSCMQETIIKLATKLDNLYHPNGQRSKNKKSSVEIDISDLNALGLPAESLEDLETQEANLKNMDYKTKLVSLI